MKTKYFIFAASALVALASCSNDEYIGDNNGLTAEQGDGSIQFAYTMPQNATRADIYGDAAATLLGNHFYVTGTKGTEAATYPTTTLVFDNYLVRYGVNTAGTTASNTANWEYVGVKPGTSPDENYAFLTSMVPVREVDNQTIKYWDYSTDQYHFFAFSTGTYPAVKGASTAASNIGVTNMAYGASLVSSGTAYTFDLPSVTALKEAYISDIVEVNKADNAYGKEVKLTFKSLGAKVRMGLYETVPGYSVKDVVFYKEDGTGISGEKTTAVEGAALISADAKGIAQKGQIKVYFPHVGTKYQPGESEAKADYNKASATVTLPTEDEDFTKAPTFGPLTDQLVARENKELKKTGETTWAAEDGEVFLGRTFKTASFAGVEDAAFYQAIFPVDDPSPLTLRVDYTLVPTDGAAETIVVKGAKAVVPSTYTKWLPNYAYTYIFKISDNTNGWTGATDKTPGLFPITFDAVVTEATDATGQQTTITTVATPTITTYQQNHIAASDDAVNEYSKTTGKNIYVQVMNNSAVPATLVDDLDENATGSSTKKSLLYAVTLDPSAKVGISEATVMDALENQASATGTPLVITGRSGVILTSATIDATVTSIVNGADDNPIEVNAGEAAMIQITGTGSPLAAGTYAYVYDYSTAAKVTKNVYQPITTSTTSPIGPKGKYSLAVSVLTGLDDGTTDANYTSTEKAVKDVLYFSITTNGGAEKVYSFVSVDDKIGEDLPDGLLKVPASNLVAVPDNTVNAAADTFYFDMYINNDGKYAVKVIKVVA